MVTVIEEVPLLPSLEAVIVAGPWPTANTSPVLLTVVTAAFEVAQDIVRPVSAFPPTSLGVAVSCWVAPNSKRTVEGLTVTVANGPGPTVTAAVPLTPSANAVIVAEPTDPPETRPASVTLATT